MSNKETAFAKIRQIAKTKEDANEQKIIPINKSSITSIASYPDVNEDIVFIKIDMFDYLDKEEITLKLNLRTQSHLDKYYEEKEEDQFQKYSTKIFKVNDNNKPSDFSRAYSRFIIGDWKEHEHFKELLDFRSDLISQCRGKQMDIQPFYANLYETNKKNEGIQPFYNAIVWQEKGRNPNVLLKLGTYAIHQELPMTADKTNNKVVSNRHYLYSFKQKIRPYEMIKVKGM